MNYVISLVKAIRNARNKQNVALSKPIEIIVKPRNAEIGQALKTTLPSLTASPTQKVYD